MTLNPQGAPKPHERLGATADDVLAELQEALFHLAYELQNDIIEKGYALLEDVGEMREVIYGFRKRMEKEELDALGDKSMKEITIEDVLDREQDLKEEMEKLREGLKDFEQEDEGKPN